MFVFTLRLMLTRQQTEYQPSLGIKHNRIIECLTNNHKSSCGISIEKKIRASHCLKLDGAEWTLLFLLTRLKRIDKLSFITSETPLSKYALGRHIKRFWKTEFQHFNDNKFVNLTKKVMIGKMRCQDRGVPLC